MSRRALAAGLCLLLLAACGGGGHEHDGAAAGGDDHSHDHSHEESGGHSGEPVSFPFGVPGDPSAAAQTIEVTAGDPFRFDPETLEVGAGETVTFVVTNEGDQQHEFVLGDRSYQEGHADAMAEGSMHHEGNAVTVAPGETQELTWTFPSKGEVLYGCHVSGHYEGGMFGVIRIAA